MSITSNGVLTLCACMLFASYSQVFFLRLCITLVVSPRQSGNEALRIRYTGTGTTWHTVRIMEVNQKDIELIGGFGPMKDLTSIAIGKKILFVSTKNRDYIRNQQEIHLLQSYSDKYVEIVYNDKSYLKRILKVWVKCCSINWKRIDGIVVGFAPQLMLPFLIHWNKKQTVIIDFFISMYDTCVCDRHYFKEKSLVAKLLHWIDRITLLHCSHVITDTKADRQYFSKEFSIPEEKMEVLYLEADSSIYYPMETNRTKEKTVFHVLYFGSILPVQGVDVVLDAIRLLSDRTDIFFTIIGPIKNKNKSTRINHPNAEFFEWLSQEELAERIAEADLCLAGHFNASIGKAKRTIPGKAYIYEAMGKSMILGENSANREVFAEDEHHCFVEMGSAEALAKMIIKRKEQSKQRHEQKH